MATNDERPHRPHGRILAQRAAPPVRIREGEHVAAFVGGVRSVRDDKGLGHELHVEDDDVTLPWHCNLPRSGVVTSDSKLGQTMSACGIDPTEPLREDSFTGLRVRVHVVTKRHGVRYDPVTGKRRRVLLPEAEWRSIVAHVIGLAP